MLPWKTNEFLIVTKKSDAGRNRKKGYFFIMSKMKYIVEEKKNQC